MLTAISEHLSVIISLFLVAHGSDVTHENHYEQGESLENQDTI